MSDASKIPKRNNWEFFKQYVDICEEYTMSDLVQYYIGYMFNRTLMIFKWNDLPDEMTSFDMEKFTQLKGFTLFIKDEKDGNRFYVLDGSVYDNITWNYEPSKSLIVNPALNGLKQKYELGKDAILIRNDYNRIGLYPIFEKNALDIANTDISIRYAQFNTRFKTLFVGQDDNGIESLNGLIEKVWKGEKPVGIVAEDLYKKSIDGVSYNNGQSNDIQSLISLKQYQLAQFYIELGINANYNMKPEFVSSSEFKMNNDALVPLIDQMLECRKEACEKINKLFGLNISVELDSTWKKIFTEVKNQIDKEKAEVKKLEAEASSDESSEESTEEPKDGDDNVEEKTE